MATTTTTTAFMNNGEETWMFTITGDAAEVLKINAAGVIVKEKEITTREEARKFWALAFKLAPMAKGNLMPLACDITDILRDELDPNWAERELAELQG